jgi:hypothetical protein
MAISEIAAARVATASGLVMREVSCLAAAEWKVSAA